MGRGNNKENHSNKKLIPRRFDEDPYDYNSDAEEYPAATEVLSSEDVETMKRELADSGKTTYILNNFNGEIPIFSGFMKELSQHLGENITLKSMTKPEGGSSEFTFGKIS